MSDFLQITMFFTFSFIVCKYVRIQNRFNTTLHSHVSTSLTSVNADLASVSLIPHDWSSVIVRRYKM